MFAQAHKQTYALLLLLLWLLFAFYFALSARTAGTAVCSVVDQPAYFLSSCRYTNLTVVLYLNIFTFACHLRCAFVCA